MCARSPSPQVAFTNPDKLYFPAAGFTKGDGIQYYLAIAGTMIPHLRDRPVTLIRMPDGVTGERFYQKNAPRHTPAWIKTSAVKKKSGGKTQYIVVQDPATLAWCANYGAVEFHPFLHRVDHPERPTHAAFDLDPGEGADLLTCIKVGFILRDMFTRLGLQSFPKVTGSKGLQVYVPLNQDAGYEAVNLFARTLAELVEREHPDLVVSNMSKRLRRGKVLIDWSQNHARKTTVCVYSLRGKRDRPYVSVPVTWDELKRAQRARKADRLFFSPADTLRRVKRRGDLFAPVLTLRQSLPPLFAGDVPRSRASSALRAYEEKRDFARTAEPRSGAAGSSASGGPARFVIQKHAASRLHFDFRLEMDGVLKSWAVPKGLATARGVKRAAIEVEDHPLAYATFEGVIPAGEYGGGTVMVFDQGTYELLAGDHASGNLKLRLSGKKYAGEWHLFRIDAEARQPMWLIAKSGRAARALTRRQETTSVLSGRTMEQIARAGDAVWRSPPRRRRAARPSHPVGPKSYSQSPFHPPSARSKRPWHAPFGKVRSPSAW